MPQLFFSFAISLLFVFTSQAQQYMWPTNSGQFLSSTFGETRSAHFHAGLDIKTWGQEGYKVFASRDGILHRLQVTERGYGKAVYLKHPDGTYTTYAHLQRFNEKFQAIADSIRLRDDYSFELEVYLDTVNIEVKQGDVIGFTGSSGIGPPHLHFEIRDSLENPVNALTTNLSVSDDIPPIFSSLLLEPLNINSRVDGGAYSKVFPVLKKENGRYFFGEANINGKIGLAVSVYDKANRVPNNYAIYTLSLLHKGDTLFHQQLDMFSYDKTSEMYLDRIAPFGSSRRSYQRLYAKDGSENPFYQSVMPAATIEPADTAKSYTIIASDYFGNTSKAEIIIKGSLPFTSSDPAFDSLPDNWYWNENWASPDLKNTIDFTSSSFGNHWNKNQQLLFIDDLTINFARIIPDSIQRITTPDRRLLVQFGKDAFFDTLTVAVSYEIEEEEIFISVHPDMLATKSKYRIEFYLGDVYQKGNNYQLYNINSNNRLSHVSSELIGRTLHATVSGLGRYVIKTDHQPPQVYNFQLEKTDYGVWLGKVTVNDKLSGINSETAEFWINDKRGIAEYDYEENLLIYYLPDFTPESSNTAVIKVEDKAGNEKVVTFNK